MHDIETNPDLVNVNKYFTPTSNNDDDDRRKRFEDTLGDLKPSRKHYHDHGIYNDKANTDESKFDKKQYNDDDMKKRVDNISKKISHDTSDASRFMESIFSKSNILIFAWFLAIYFIIFIIVQKLFFKRPASVATSTLAAITSPSASRNINISLDSSETSVSKLVDFTLLILLIVLCAVGYNSLSKYDQEHFLKYCWQWMKDDLNDPKSGVIFAFFLLAFYLTIYLLRIPMGADTKPLSIEIIESKLWIWFILIIIVQFFNNVLNIPIIDWMVKGFSNIWSGNNFEFGSSYNKYHNILIDDGHDFKIIDSSVVTGSGSGSGTVPISSEKQVFNIGDNLYTYDDAQAVCKAYGADLATYEHIEQSYNDGGEWCNYGWSANQMGFFPTQKETWKKLQESPDHKNDCGRPGINGGYMANPNIRFGVNCFGVKPSPKDIDQDYMDGKKNPLGSNVPMTEEDKEMMKKIEYWKNHENSMLINSFNSTKWSEY